MARLKIGVLGAKGNMGTRYSLILKACGHEVVEIDLGQPKSDLHGCDGIVIATPTSTHTQLIREFAHKPILCEKPITKDLADLSNLVEIKGLNLRMMNQYQYYFEKQKEQDKRVKEEMVFPLPPETFFNYYKHGGDGLIWDCINIIGLSSGKIELYETGFIWECTIDNLKLSIADMDRAYVWNIRNWVENFDNNHDYILKAHRKCAEMAKYAYKS